MSNNLNLNDIFYSTQGEGEYVGVPTLFFRFNNCNINCEYCDTIYNASYVNLGETLFDDIKGFLDNYLIRHICFTGGEPLLFKQDISIILNYIYNELRYRDFVIKIETNGLIGLPLMIYSIPNKIIFSVTPKLDHLLEYDILNFQANPNKINYKFMVDKDEAIFTKQLDEICLFIETMSINYSNIYFSPINKAYEDILENYKQIFKNIIKYRKHKVFSYMRNFRGITIQLHKLLEVK